MAGFHDACILLWALEMANKAGVGARDLEEEFSLQGSSKKMIQSWYHS